MLPLAPLKKLAKDVGVERISDSAVEELKDVVEELGEEIARDSVTACRHAGRLTIKKEDIDLATK